MISAVLVCVAAGLCAPAIAQEGRSGHAIVRRVPPIVLSSPPANTQITLTRVLQAAGVRYGLEQAPVPPDGAAIDLGQKPRDTIVLNNRTLSEALDIITKEDPRYEWYELGDRVIVRVAAMRGVGALDARVPQFAVSDVTYVEALAALGRAIDSERPDAPVGRFGVAVQAGSGPFRWPQPDDGPKLTLALNDATLLEILEAIGRAHGNLSWSVAYDGTGTGLENASITMMSGGAGAAVLSREALRLAASRRERVVVPTFGRLDIALSFYSDRTKTQVGFERVGEDPRDLAGEDPQIDLTNTSRSEAIARLVALDSRYSWQDAGGIYNIRPAGGHASEHSILDVSLPPMALGENTAEASLELILAPLGRASGTGVGSGGVPGLSYEQQQKIIQEERTRTVSLVLQTTTLREALNALCRAHGTLSWFYEIQQHPGQPRNHTITLRSFNGWTTSRTLHLNPGP